jgi:shikimate dehydrogenase
LSALDAETRLCGVVGHPVRHSLSPVIHNAALRHDGRNTVYLAFDVTDVASASKGLAAVGAVGVNVTIPHKRAAWDHASWHSPEAIATGAANTLLFDKDGRIAAHNTDPAGVLGGLHDLGVSPEGLRCLVVGAGGAGRAAIRALHSAGAADVLVANRTKSHTADLLAEVVAWDELPEALARAEIVVHATSVGMDGEDTFLQVNALSASRCKAVLDLVYGREETDLVRRTGARGIPAADGLGVLVHQAAKSYELFWDAPAPFQVMLEAAFRATGRRWH